MLLWVCDAVGGSGFWLEFQVEPLEIIVTKYLYPVGGECV